MTTHELHSYFNFDGSDLSANRAGRLTTSQQEKLKVSEKKSKRYFAGLTMFMFLLGVIITNQILNSVTNKMEAYVGAGVIWLVLGVFILIFIAMAVAKYDYSIANVEGEVNFVLVEKTRTEKSASGSSRTKTYRVYEMRVGKFNFHDVPEHLLNLIKEGDLYVVYYLPNLSNKILSLELIRKGS